jgi:DNA-binding LytR/AlgR family response regulator
MSKQKTIVDYIPSSKPKWGENIIALLNQQFVIRKVYFDQGSFGEVGIIEIEPDGKTYYTSSKVLLKQLKEIAALIAEGKMVRVMLKRVKRYLTF